MDFTSIKKAFICYTWTPVFFEFLSIVAVIYLLLYISSFYSCSLLYIYPGIVHKMTDHVNIIHSTFLSFYFLCSLSLDFFLFFGFYCSISTFNPGLRNSFYFMLIQWHMKYYTYILFNLNSIHPMLTKFFTILFQCWIFFFFFRSYFTRLVCVKRCCCFWCYTICVLLRERNDWNSGNHLIVEATIYICKTKIDKMIGNLLFVQPLIQIDDWNHENSFVFYLNILLICGLL